MTFTLPSNEIAPEDFANLLAYSVGDLGDTKWEIERRCDFRVPRSSYDAVWSSLSSALGRSDAAMVAFDICMDRASPRLKETLRDALAGAVPSIQCDDPHEVGCLFFGNGKPRRIGKLLLAYLRSETPEAAEARATLVPKTRTKLAQLAGEPKADGIWSAGKGGLHLLEVDRFQGRVLSFGEGVSERHVEQYFVDHWSEINFAIGGRVQLVSRQVQLKSNSTQAIDLVGRSEDGGWVLIELKARTASGRDLAQLLSYANDLCTELQVEPAKVRAVLVAPDFGAKVLGAAAMSAVPLTLLSYAYEGDEDRD